MILIAIGAFCVSLGAFGLAYQIRRFENATLELVVAFSWSVGIGLALVLRGCGVG